MAPSATSEWLSTLENVLDLGTLVSPRGKSTKELLHWTTIIDMRNSVVQVPERKLNYRFMAAEAYWILTGDNSVAGIAPYNKNIGQYSDNGESFFGAYGPKVMDQMNYVVNTLLRDQETRQAGLTIWRENPPPTKDVPCTVSMFFSLRGWRLNSHVFMRSNDQWFGLPYDIFNFSCISYLVCGRLNARLNTDTDVKPGNLFLTAMSSHLYEPQWQAARELVDRAWPDPKLTVPRSWYTDPNVLLDDLKNLREKDRAVSSKRWWENA